VGERRETVQKVDALRTEVNALHAAYGAALIKPALSHTAHKVAASAFAVEAAMREGKPLAAPLAAAVASSGGDPLVAAAAAAVPAASAHAGTATREMLYEQYVPSSCCFLLC
jgi:hypothetical protein